MESEKVKEIKKALEQYNSYIPFVNEHYNWDEVSNADILTYINELESEKDNLYNLNQNLISDKQVLMQENERLRDEIELQQITDKAYKYNMACENGKQIKQISELKEENQKFKDRIVELEKQMCRNEDLHNATEKLNDIIILKQFAERLKEKRVDYYTKGIIDETLKEFVGVEK